MLGHYLPVVSCDALLDEGTYLSVDVLNDFIGLEETTASFRVFTLQRYQVVIVVDAVDSLFRM